MIERLTDRLVGYALDLSRKLSDEGTRFNNGGLSDKDSYTTEGKLRGYQDALDQFYSLFPDLKPTVQARLSESK